MAYLNPVVALRPCVSAMVSAVACATAATTQKVASVASAVMGVISSVASRVASIAPSLKNAAHAYTAFCARSPALAVALSAATVTTVAYVALQHFGVAKAASSVVSDEPVATQEEGAPAVLAAESAAAEEVAPAAEAVLASAAVATEEAAPVVAEAAPVVAEASASSKEETVA